MSWEILTNQMTALYSWSFTVDCAIVKRWWPILEQSFKFAGVLWLLEWSSCEKLCLVGKINQYASEWQQGCLNVWFFNIFFKPETEVVVAWICWSLHPLLVYMVYRPRDLYESDSSPCEHYLACQDKDRTWFGLTIMY